MYHDEFDTKDIDEGMDEIDILMDQLQGTMPDDAYEVADFDIDEMVRVNLNLRDKIKDITFIVKESITKAGELKRSIHTHRDPPKDPEVKDKRTQIKQYQNAVNLWKSYIAALNNKIESMADVERLDKANNKIKKLSRDIRKLEDHKIKLKVKLNNQIKTINNLYSDPEFKEKLSKTYEEINKAKEVYDKCKHQRKNLKEKQKLISEDYVKINSDYRKLKDRKIALQNNVSPQKLFKKDYDLADEYEALKKRNENYEKMATNKQIKMIDKILHKEMRWNEIDQQITEIKAKLDESNAQNKLLAKEAKNLKWMLPPSTLKVRNSPEKPLFTDNHDLFIN